MFVSKKLDGKKNLNEQDEGRFHRMCVCVCVRTNKKRPVRF